MAVLVMRPGEKGSQLVEILNKSGIAAIHLPLFNIVAGRELNELPNKLYQLKSGDIIFAASKSAVEFSAETLKSIGFQWRNDVQYFAVGQSSAGYFSERTEQAVIYPFGQENSEGLLNLPELQRLDGKTVLILRGNGGRELFPKQAVIRGANLEIIESYQRVPIEYDQVKQTDLCKRAGISVIVVTSTELLNALIDFVPMEEHDWLKSCRLVTVSRRIAHLAIKCGWKLEQILIAPRADNASLAQALVQTRP